jgi:hypothetical protein
MVLCNVMAWTDETEGLTVLVTRSDPVAGTVTTEEKAMPRMPLMGTAAQKCYMERKWWMKL